MKRKLIPAEESFREWKNDPKYLAEYDALDEKFRLASALIETRSNTNMAQQAQMLIAARSSILKSGDFISPKEVAKLAGYSETNPSVYPNKWERNRQIFAIQNEGKDYFPLYALDSGHSFRPRKAVADVLRVFGDSKDGWGIALWFASLNSFLDDERPQDLLATEAEQVIAAAEDEMAGVRHG